MLNPRTWLLFATALAASPLLVRGESPEPPAKASKGPETVALIGDTRITAEQLDALAAAPMTVVRTQEYNVRRSALEDLIARTLLEREAATRHLGVEELTRIEIQERARPVTEEQTKAAYEASRDRFPGVPEPLALKQLGAALQQQRIAERRTEYLKELKARAGVKMLLEAPRVAVDASKGVSRGPKDAPVTIVEFADYQCPYCSRSSAALKEISERYREKVRIVFRDFPLPIHGDAQRSAEAAACANEQGKFWEMHDKLFESQQNLGDGALKRCAADIGLDAGEFSSCLESGRNAAKWKADKEDGSRYGVTGTPAFFVNGRFLGGLQPVQVFVQVVEEELERAARPSASALRN